MAQPTPMERFSSLEQHRIRIPVRGDPTFKTSGLTLVDQMAMPLTLPLMAQSRGHTIGTLKNLKQVNTPSKFGRVTVISVMMNKEHALFQLVL